MLSLLFHTAITCLIYLPAAIDQSILTIAEPKRRRDKAHLRFVVSQPCLVSAGVNPQIRITCSLRSRAP